MHTALKSIRRKAVEEVGPVSDELLALSNQLHRTRDKLLRLQYRREAGGRTDLDRRIEELEETRRRIGMVFQGNLVEFGLTKQLFTKPVKKKPKTTSRAGSGR